MKRYLMLILLLSVLAFMGPPACPALPATVNGDYDFLMQVDASGVFTIGAPVTFAAVANLGTTDGVVSGKIYLNTTKTGDKNEIPNTAQSTLEGTIKGAGSDNWYVEWKPVTFTGVKIMMKNDSVQEFDVTLTMTGDGNQTVLVFPNNANEMGGTLTTKIIQDLTGLWSAKIKSGQPPE